MVRLVAVQRRNRPPNEWNDELNLKRYRKSVETRNSQLDEMGIERLYARTNTGFEIKLQATLLALIFTNLS